MRIKIVFVLNAFLSIEIMEGRVIEYRPGGGLDYHNSPLIGEIPAGDYSHIHRSIDQLRSLNERGILTPIITHGGPYNKSYYIANTPDDRIDYTATIKNTIIDECPVSDNEIKNSNNSSPSISNDVKDLKVKAQIKS